MIADATGGHADQRLLDDVALPGSTRIAPAGEQELARGGMRELGRGAEAAIAYVEQPRHLIGRGVEQGGLDHPGLRLVQRSGDVRANVARALLELRLLGVPRVREPPQQREKAGPPVRILLGRKVGAAVENFARGRQKRRERPATLAGEGLDGALIAGVHVGPLVAVDLHAHVFLTEDLSDLGVFVALPIHHVAPVAPDRADVEQDGLAFGLRAAERLVTPRQPLHRLMSGGLEVGRGFGGERVGHGDLKHPLPDNAAPPASAAPRRSRATPRRCRTWDCDAATPFPSWAPSRRMRNTRALWRGRSSCPPRPWFARRS